MVRVRRGLAVALMAGAVVAGGASMAAADAGAQGVAAYSPGVGSGNLIQVPIHIPVNACGNTVSVIGLLNPAFGNTCVNA
ncbi:MULTISPECIES: chaplin [Streptomyces]|uniref:chaplin n=1 Tax=Streptomyces TaxID=1883 RepID=UPI0004BDEBCE|nr:MULTISPECIES: chaplin [Streptomyces]KJY19889.1 chaplin [Streptomyces sp. NRRL S-104]KOU38656.1 chaplin [Streptomyces sp. WM6373]KOU65029.1 chaplin [Streptomyces sp. IGB124]KOU74505.1 chaplin [Streptomyces sp. XY66]KOU85081.1 chaplin [Streptomyces sp. XY58]